MCTNYAPLPADLILNSYETRFIKTLIKIGKHHLAKAFNFTSNILTLCHLIIPNAVTTLVTYGILLSWKATRPLMITWFLTLYAQLFIALGVHKPYLFYNSCMLYYLSYRTSILNLSVDTGHQLICNQIKWAPLYFYHFIVIDVAIKSLRKHFV